MNMNDNTKVSKAAESAAAAAEASRSEPALLPPTDVIEDAAGITLFADLPGVPKDKLGVHIDGETLTIEGEIAFDMPKELQATHAEVSLSRYRRVFTLSKELDPESLSAELRNGVLKLRISKAPHAQPRRIEVQVA